VLSRVRDIVGFARRRPWQRLEADALARVGERVDAGDVVVVVLYGVGLGLAWPRQAIAPG
jgi:hypothetical protein